MAGATTEPAATAKRTQNACNASSCRVTVGALLPLLYNAMCAGGCTEQTFWLEHRTACMVPSLGPITPATAGQRGACKETGCKG